MGMLGQKHSIPLDRVTEARDGKASILIWGWGKYRDQFDADHEVRFARRLDVTGISEETDPSGKKRITVAVSISVFGQYDCADEECH
jgi:hypothetical protein